MIPEPLSSTLLDSTFLFPRNITRLPLQSYEHGGIGIQDPSAGLRAKVWISSVADDDVITLSAPGVTPAAILTVPELEQIDFTFDQNMNPFIAYQLADGTAEYYWYDSTVADFTITTLPAGSSDPRCSLDDKRPLQSGNSDVILAYMRAGSLFARCQRDRYLVEYELIDGQGSRGLIQIGMNTKLRFQYHVTTA